MTDAVKTVTYDNVRRGKHYIAEIHVEQATTRILMERQELENKVRKEAKETGEVVPFLRGFLWPGLVAASPEGEITVDDEPLPWPIPYEELEELPNDLTVKWEMALYAQNPHWFLGHSAEKKVSENG